MNYMGKLYGKVGRNYIPLVMTSDDVEDMEKKLAEVTLLSEGRLTLLNNQEQRHKAEIEDAKAKIELLKSMIISIADRIGDEWDGMWQRSIIKRLEEICKAKGGGQ